MNFRHTDTCSGFFGTGVIYTKTYTHLCINVNLNTYVLPAKLVVTSYFVSIHAHTHIQRTEMIVQEQHTDVCNIERATGHAIIAIVCVCVCLCMRREKVCMFGRGCVCERESTCACVCV